MRPNRKKERLSDDAVRERGFNPFLRPEHVSDGESLQLTGFNTKRKSAGGADQIVCEVQTEQGHTFDLGVRIGSPDHRTLHRALGSDYEKWSGTVVVTIREGRDTAFVNVASADVDPPMWSDR